MAESRHAPAFRVMPEGSTSLGPLAVEFMREHDFVLDDWQEDILSDWLTLDANGKFAAETCGLGVPRQNGKTHVMKGRAYFGICVLGETILWTAHEVKTERKTFEEIAADFDPVNGYPDLSAQVESIRRANGQEEIRLKDWQDSAGEWHRGGRLIFSARSRGASRGFTADVCLLDESQELSDEQLSAILPTISAGPLQRPQVIMIGTPPAANTGGDVFANTRRRAMSGESVGLAWHEWSAAPVPRDDKAALWDAVARANPALDTRIMRSAIEAELDTMAEDYFARERLGYWFEAAQDSAEYVISADAWNACATDNPPDDGLLCYAVKFSPTGRAAALCVCLKPPEGPPHVELVAVHDLTHGAGNLAAWLLARKDKAAQIVVDGLAGAGALVQRLIDGKVPKQALIQPRSGDVVAACAAFVDAVSGHAVTHYSQAQLTNAATLCARRPIGRSGGFGFASTDFGDASIIEAAALAFYAAQTTKRRPGRRAGIW